MCSPIRAEIYDESSPGPLGLTGHKIICDWQDNGFYLVGGWTPEFTTDDPEDSDVHYYRQVWKYNFSAKTWKRLESKNHPPNLASHCVTKMDTESLGLLIYGGSLSARGHLGNSNEVYIYNVNNGDWRLVQTTGERCPTFCGHWFGQSMCRARDDIFVTTGRMNNELERENGLKVHKLNLHNLTWEDLSASDKAYRNQPECRVRHEMFHYEDKIYVIGGAKDFMDTVRSFTMESVPCFDIRSCTWSTLSTTPDKKHGFPKARFCHTLSVVGDFAYLLGGRDQSHDFENEEVENYNENFGEVYRDLWRLHIPTLQWIKFAEFLPTPLWFHSSDVTSEGQLFAYGGCTSENYQAYRSTDTFRINVGHINKLETLSWRVIANNGRFSRSRKDNEFYDIGLNNKYLSKFFW